MSVIPGAPSPSPNTCLANFSTRAKQRPTPLPGGHSLGCFPNTPLHRRPPPLWTAGPAPPEGLEPPAAHLELAHELGEDAEEGLRGGGFGVVLSEEGQRPAQLLHGLALQPVQRPQHRLRRLQEGLGPLLRKLPACRCPQSQPSCPCQLPPAQHSAGSRALSGAQCCAPGLVLDPPRPVLPGLSLAPLCSSPPPLRSAQMPPPSSPPFTGVAPCPSPGLTLSLSLFLFF